MLRTLFAALLLAGSAAAEPIAGPVRVIDADTIDVGHVRVRLHGIDAAEADQTCDLEGAVWRCGAWAAGRVRDLFEGRAAACERVDTDRYGRAVARCAVEGADAIADAKAGPGVPVDMGAEIVGRGLAVAYRRYSDEYVGVEAQARAREAGVFSGAMEEPATHRRGASGRAPPDPACPIKGNVSANGRIFHPPGGAFYDRTAIDEGRGERWFCTAEEALAAGWRAAMR